MLPASGVNLLPTVTCISAALPQVPLTLTPTRSSTAHQDPKGTGYRLPHEYLQSAAHRAASPGMPLKDTEEKKKPITHGFSLIRKRGKKEGKGYVDAQRTDSARDSSPCHLVCCACDETQHQSDKIARWNQVSDLMPLREQRRP